MYKWCTDQAIISNISFDKRTPYSLNVKRTLPAIPAVQPSTLFRRRAPGQGAGRSQHRVSWRRSRRTKGYTLPSNNTNKPSPMLPDVSDPDVRNLV